MKMSDLDKMKTFADACKYLGSEEEAMHCLKTGIVGKWHRKNKQERDRAILEAAKDDPRFKDIGKKAALPRSA